VQQASAEPELYKRACAYRMHGERVDGMDVLAVYQATSRLLAMARDERKPSLLECATYRFRGHSVADPGKSYRSPDEVERWRKRDPVLLIEQRLRKQGVLDDASVQEIQTRVEGLVNRAVEEAAAAPDPGEATLYEHMYGPDAEEQFERNWPGSPFGEQERFDAAYGGNDT
jgi:pyruvate dehydrogenase E1 component alpha subunit